MAAAAARVPPVAAARVGLLYDERMCAHATPDGEEHPENPERLRAIWRKLNAEGIASRCVALKAKEAEDKYIASVHSKNHIKLMREISSKKYDSSRNKIARKFNSIYFNKGSSESALLAAGSVIEVAEKVAAGELSSAIALVRPPGHHAEHDKAMGFCLFNNVAVAANYLLNERPDLGIKKILIVDWDVHHGNGTQKMFYNDPRVLFFSVHRFDYGSFYPAQGDASHCFIGEEAGNGYNINVPWEHGRCGDADYIAAWDHVLLPVVEAYDPDIILVSAGFDAALGDPLGGCCITPNGYALLLTKLLGFAQGRIVMALEGGYNLRSIAYSVFACAKVLLGDKFTFNSPEMPPFESTWRVIQAVRNELKTCWPVLSSKLPKNVTLRIGPSPNDLYASSGCESDGEDVNELSGAVSSVNIIQVADDAVSERLSKMKLDEDNHAMKATSSCSTAEQQQHPTDSVGAHNDASVVVSKRISDLSVTWRSVLSRTYVWYSSFGSNMWKPRFMCYIQGGKVEGMSIPCCGSRDTSSPRGTMWKTVPHRLLFGRSSTPCWGTGGVAFLNPEINYNEKSYVFMYKITLEQFNDVLFQENRLVLESSKDGNIEYPDSPLIGSSEMEFMSTNKALHLEPIKDSWYSNVLYLGKEDDLPILSMTCPSSDIERYKSGELPLSPPSKTYAATLIKGLVEGNQLDEAEAASYINVAAARGL
ncbi:histone deacetylase 5-like [Phragmites australis]|uniref:histone deacetylase 5-like n=1 Tax=Phragmites australis TaxID=29695 RepID=UPI002D769247|nr:histone deacetylase 5-like [Phragmites australis]